MEPFREQCFCMTESKKERSSTCHSGAVIFANKCSNCWEVKFMKQEEFHFHVLELGFGVSFCFPVDPHTF